MAFGAWFCVDDATFLLTARAARNACPSAATLSSGRRFPWNSMKRRIQFHVVQFGLDAATQPTDDVADVIDQLGLSPLRERNLLCRDAVFHDGRTAAPLHNFLVVKALPAPRRPPPYNI